MSPRPAIPALAAAAVTGVVLAARWAATRRARRRGAAPEDGAAPAGAAATDGPGDGGPRKETRTGTETLDEVGQELRRYWDRLRPLYPDQHS